MHIHIHIYSSTRISSLTHPARAVIHRLHLGKRGSLSPNECSVYDIEQSDAEAPVMLELWGMQSTPSLPSLPSPLLPGVVAPDRVLSKIYI